MQRFFVTFPLGIDVELVDITIINQITRVLRMKEGESVTLFDGDGSETEYILTMIKKKKIHLRWMGRTFPRTEPQIQVVLYQALPNKYEKIEYILQKWIEVGIRKFVFFRSDRSQRLIISPSKIDRFNTIAREALEQCGGVIMPEIYFDNENTILSSHDKHWTQASLVDSWVNQEWRKQISIVLDTIGKSSRISEFRGHSHIGLFIGPEWGWSEEEREKMLNYGFIFAHFWERVLRTETAGVVTAFSLINQ